VVKILEEAEKKGIVDPAHDPEVARKITDYLAQCQRYEQQLKQSAMIYLAVSSLKLTTRDTSVYHVRLEIDQNTNLERAPQIFVPGATTWSKSLIGIVSQREMELTIRKNVSDLVDSFLNDYLSVNPKLSSGLRSALVDQIQLKNPVEPPRKPTH
jgi:hypothetical protein